MHRGWAVQALRLLSLSLAVGGAPWAAAAPDESDLDEVDAGAVGGAVGGEGLPGSSQAANFLETVVGGDDGEQWLYLRQSRLDADRGYSQDFRPDGPVLFQQARGVAVMDAGEADAVPWERSGPGRWAGGSLLARSLEVLVSASRSDPGSQWVYVVRASPNMVPVTGAPAPYGVLAVGGVLWAQVPGYALLRHGRVVEWRNNPRWDMRFATRMGPPLPPDMGPVLRALGLNLNPAAPGRVQARGAYNLMQYITGSNRNGLGAGRGLIQPGVTEDQFRFRRVLLDWDPLNVPRGLSRDREFPLFRPVPPDLGSSIAGWQQRQGDDWHRCVTPGLLDYAPLGIFTVAEILMAAFDIQRFRHGGGSGGAGKGKRDTPAPAACAPLQLPDQPSAPLPLPAPPCRHIRALRLGFQILDGINDGTFSSLDLAFAGSPGRHRIASSPDAGFHQWQDIDLRATFGDSIIHLDRLAQLHIVQVNDGAWWDVWKLQGLKLRATCADSLTELELDKFASLNTVIEPPRPAPGPEATVWSAAVDPSTDWKTRIHCSALNHLHVDFELSNWIASGTFDDILIRFDHQRPDQDLILLRHPDRGARESFDVDIPRTFGTPVVPFSRINWFDVYSREDGVHGPDMWRTQGIRFTARCHDSTRVAVLDKFANVEEKLKRLTDEADLKRNITLSDWHWEAAAATDSTLLPKDEQ